MAVTAPVAEATELLRPLTYEDLADFPDDGVRREIITGELVVSPAPTMPHQIVLGRLHRVIANFVDERNLGIVTPAPTDVRLTRTDIVQPDIVYVSAQRSEIVRFRNIEGAPDLVVEVLSASTRRVDLVRKRALYAWSGIREYWMVDEEARTIEPLRLVGDRYEPIPPIDGTYPSVVLDGLDADPEKLFANLPVEQEEQA